MFLNHRTQYSLKYPAWLHLLASEFYHCLRISKIDLDVADDTSVSDTPPWSQSEPQICLSLTKYKTVTTNPEIYKQVFLEVTSRHQNYVQIFTDGSKVDEKVAAAAVLSVAPNSPFSFVDWETTVLFTQRSCKQFCLLLNKHINLEKENSWFSQTHYPLYKRSEN